MADAPSQQQARQQRNNNQRQVIALLVINFRTHAGYVLISSIVDALSRLTHKPDADTLRWLAFLGAQEFDNIETGLIKQGPAESVELAQAIGWRALYLVAAAERLADAEEAGTLDSAREKEERFFESHLAAEERRRRSAALVDAARNLLADRTEVDENLVGWRAVLDGRTTPECRWAHGRNFDATKIPSIGWPGAVHMRCRCSVGPAIPGAPLIPPA